MMVRQWVGCQGHRELPINSDNYLPAELVQMNSLGHNNVTDGVALAPA